MLGKMSGNNWNIVIKRPKMGHSKHTISYCKNIPSCCTQEYDMMFRRTYMSLNNGDFNWILFTQVS